MLQTAQKYSAESGSVDVRHSAQTGTRVHLSKARLQMRQSSGKNSEKIPWGIPRIREEAAVLVTGLLEKAHLRAFEALEQRRLLRLCPQSVVVDVV